MTSGTPATCGNGDREGWIFRGQAEAVWKLLPSAFRKSAFRELVPGQLTDFQLAPLDRLRYEIFHAKQFAARASHHGFEVPGDSPELREPSDVVGVEDLAADFPPLRERGLFALAQHYGIPTRLLDWTYNPLAAAYFAAVEPAKRLMVTQRAAPEESDGRLAIWALQRGLLNVACREWNPGAITVSAPGFNIPNLQAQRGLFTLVRFKTKQSAVAELPTLDEIIKASDRAEEIRNLPGFPPLPHLYKFTLPQSQAPRLLYFLDRAEVNVATLFPTLQSVKDHMVEIGYQSRTFPGAK
jgi:hypothetical protein